MTEEEPDYEIHYEDIDPSLFMSVGSATPLQEYHKPRRQKIRRRPIGFLRDDWPDIVE